MGKTEAESEIDELLEECVDLLQRYVVDLDKGDLDSGWLRTQLELYEHISLDFGEEVTHFVRSSYENLKEAVPRDVCGFLRVLVDMWCEGTEDELPHTPTGTETNMYLALAGHFRFDSGKFSHLAVIRKLDEVYCFMVDGDYQVVPGVTAVMGSRQRRHLREKAVRRYIREHPEARGVPK